MVHVVIVSFPAPGHINPTLQFAKVLLQRGIQITFGTTVQAQAYIASSTTTDGISFATVSDGFDSEADVNNSEPHYPRRYERYGSASLAELIRSLTASGHPVDCVAFNFLLPWAARVAHEHGIPSALIWPQPVSVLALYYHYLFTCPESFADLSKEIQLPCLPPLVTEDLPSFFLPGNTHPHAIPMLREMFDNIHENKCGWAFTNSFDALEEDVIASLREHKINATGIGPLIPSLTPKTIKQAVKEAGKKEEIACNGAHEKPAISNDQNAASEEKKPEPSEQDNKPKKSELVEWLDAKPAGSVVYVSFGSIADVKSLQIDELAAGLMGIDHPFVWVIRPPADYPGFPAGFEDVVEKRGMVVRWCAQVEVLNHPAVGGFVTHSGWNSTLEGLVSGKPMVCVPQWSDQATNAKIVSHKWKTGLRGRKNDKGVIEREEFKRCVGLLMGEESGKEMRENAAKYKELAKLAIQEGGSSDLNIKAFIEALQPQPAVAAAPPPPPVEEHKERTMEVKPLETSDIPVPASA
ncbi:UDP-glycosyltransferase 75C1-like [Nymphaea colorata]|uniref:UDP-glycosyltransferase 75C1-like n=1 Tax=Nymphaea colorata TaxID=210225 RepID=UPI00129E0D1B|nr:UDP-glycosyltransferase 75C1-like [Nymphaea colorata]